MTPDQILSELASQRERISQMEEQVANTLLAVLQGLKGSDDGKGEGLYESVRKLQNELHKLHLRVEAIAATVGQHESDKNQVIGGSKAAHLIVVLGSGLLAWLITRYSK